MFNKIKVKLMLFNVIIIGGIILAIALIILLGSPNTSTQRLKQEMWLTAFEGNNGKGAANSDRGLRHHRNYIYVRLDGAFNILEASPEAESNVYFNDLVKRALEKDEYSGDIEFSENNTYYFMKFFIEKDEGLTIVFSPLMTRSRYLISYGVRTVIIICIVLLLLMLGSYLMAEKALIPIKKAWQRQLDFTADASHELRTPLAVMQANLEVVLGNIGETIHSQKPWLENILYENKRMAKLVDQLLTLSRGDGAKQNLVCSNLMLDELLAEVVQSFETVAISEGISLKTDLCSDATYTGDRNMLKQLFLILIDNAIKYTDRGGVITVQLRRNERYYGVIVKDTGVGIHKDQLEKIFERFYRVQNTRGRNDNGSGLGLAIAKWIVEEHKGRIDVESEPGQGTTFVVSL